MRWALSWRRELNLFNDASKGESEVDTGRELRFHATDQLLIFLCQCFESTDGRGSVSPEDSDADFWRSND